MSIYPTVDGAAWQAMLAAWRPPQPAAPQPDSWGVLAARMRAIAQRTAGQDPFVPWLLDFVQPGETVLDVGAGAGRYALPLLKAGRTVTAVEPSAGMRQACVEAAAEMGLVAPPIIGERWPAVAAPVADVVLCANVLYDVPQVAPFVAALNAHARRAVILALRSSHPLSQLVGLYPPIHGIHPQSRPTYLDAAALIYQELAVFPQVRLLPNYSVRWTYANGEEALFDARHRLQLGGDTRFDDLLSAYLAEHLHPEGDRLILDSAPARQAVIWWEKGET